MLWYLYIYIPIWCYYYGISKGNIGNLESFTFQYGVTITGLVITLKNRLEKFTFQYGVTITH